MGTRTGRFTSIEGREYLVEFTGDSVKSAEIVLGVPPVVISMAPGEHKFCGFKSTTAVINLLTDKPLYDLYTEAADGVRVTVKDVADNKVEFDGYVVPFSFEQPRSGMNDAVTINAVDMLTARKSYTYENVGDEHGVDKTALEIVQEICRRSGIYRLAVHLNFSTPDDKTSPLDVMVAQAGFLQDEMSDVDALSAICQFFGYTGHVAGDTLYLYDEHCLCRQYGVNLYTYVTIANTGKTTWHMDQFIGYGSPLTGQEIFLDGEILSGMTTSVERAYDGIQITPQGSEVSVLLPDVCADENISALEGAEEYPLSNDTGVEYRVKRDSHVMRLGTDGLGLTDDDYIIRNDWAGAAILMNVSSMKRGEASLDNIVVKYFEKTGSGNYIRIKPTNNILSSPILIGEQWSGCTYSHTGGLVRLELSFRILAPANWKDITMSYDLGERTGRLAIVGVDCGGKRLAYDYAHGEYYDHWVDKSEYRGATGLLIRGYDLLPTGTAQSIFSGGAIFSIPSSGAISVSIEFAGFPYGSNVYEYLISSLSLKGYGEPIDLNSGDLKYRFRDGNDVLNVNTMLTTRSNGVEDITRLRINARPGVVTGGEWVGAYKGGGKGTLIPIAGVLMEQLKSRYQYARYSYTFTASKRVYPYQAVWINPMTSAVLEPTHTVESYDWDIYNNETTLTID
jgi:hypothetical protein